MPHSSKNLSLLSPGENRKVRFHSTFAWHTLSVGLRAVCQSWKRPGLTRKGWQEGRGQLCQVYKTIIPARGLHRQGSFLSLLLCGFCSSAKPSASPLPVEAEPSSELCFELTNTFWDMNLNSTRSPQPTEAARRESLVNDASRCRGTGPVLFPKSGERASPAGINSTAESCNLGLSPCFLGCPFLPILHDSPQTQNDTAKP